MLTSGLHYNVTNIYHGLQGAKTVEDSVKTLYPYIQIYVLFFCSTKSQFFEEAPLLFFIGLGLFQTYIAGLLNIASTAGIKFSYFHIEPFVYLAILYADAFRLVSPEMLKGLYALLVVEVFAKYCLFLKSIIVQLTEYLKIPFLRVKQTKLN